MKTPIAITNHAKNISKRLAKSSEKLAKLYENCFVSTADTALKELEDGSLFVLTGDIPAMWLRDSSAQVNHYVQLADDPEVASLIKGVISKQLDFILMDPYANAFNEAANGKGHTGDIPKNDPHVWERKYEIDSLCYPLRLLYRYVEKTKDFSVVDEKFQKAVRVIVDLWKCEQNHMENSPYTFLRPGARRHTYNLPGSDRGNPVAYTGMTWSGFRPSDDACTYGYLIASNMFAWVVLGYAAELLGDCDLAKEATQLRAQIFDGIEKFAIVENEKYGKIFACEADGLGNTLFMDDANIPSLISIPYIGFLGADDPVYQNTRKMLLSFDNPYYYEGKCAKGIGSPHTPAGYIWHLALSMQGLTSERSDEMREILEMMIASDADTGHMHEGFLADDPKVFTRPWFTWSDSLFCEFVDRCMEKGIV
jgi:meiotically up-regulated gene 157 (Mug157) protein